MLTDDQFSDFLGEGVSEFEQPEVDVLQIK